MTSHPIGKRTEKRTFVSRWGDPDLDDKQYVTIPGFVLRHYHKLGLTADEFQVMAHIMSFKYDAKGAQASPSLTTIARHVGRHESSVRRTIRRLREDRKVLTVTERPGLSSIYDFGELVRQCRKHELESRVDASDDVETAPGVDATPSAHATPSVDAKTTPSVDAKTPLACTPTEDLKEESENKRQKITAPKNGADVAPKPEPVRDTVFELVATRGFGIALDDAAALAAIRAKANWIASWLKGNAVKMNSRDKKKSLPGCAPPMDAAELARFYAWYEGKYQDVSIPTTAGGMAAHVGKFRAANGQRNGSAPTFTPRDDCEQCGGTGLIIAVHPDGREETVPCPDCRAAAESARKEEAIHA